MDDDCRKKTFLVWKELKLVASVMTVCMPDHCRRPWVWDCWMKRCRWKTRESGRVDTWALMQLFSAPTLGSCLSLPPQSLSPAHQYSIFFGCHLGRHISTYALEPAVGLLYYSERACPIFTARRYAKHGICRRRMSVCLSVCVSVCLSHSGIESKWLNVGSRK